MSFLETVTKAPPFFHSAEEKLLASILSGGALRWPHSSPAFAGRFLDKGYRHGVLPLVYDCLYGSPEWERCPKEIRDGLAGFGRDEAALDLVRQWEIRQVLAGLADRQVHPLLMKGTALSYTHYRSPRLRPRYDTDLLVRESETETAWDVLSTRGYERLDSAGGELIIHAFFCSRKDDCGIEHRLDVHWKLSSTQVFARSFSHEELSCQAVAVPELGKHARALSPVHALLLAAMHRISHARYGGGNKLIWLYDIHLLMQRMAKEERELFIGLALDRDLGGACLDGLTLAQALFGTRFHDPGDVIQRLSSGRHGRDRSAAFIGKRPSTYLISDLKAVSNWSGRLQMLREHFLPPADYMLRKYKTTNRSLLPFLYLRRVAMGIWKYL